MHGIRFQRLGEIWQLLAIVDGRITGDFERDSSIRILSADFIKNLELVDVGLHREVIVAGMQDKVVQEGLSHVVAVDSEIEG